MRGAAVSMAVCLMVGCGPSEVLVWKQGQAIVGGEETTGDPAVVALAVCRGGCNVYCTGSLIGPKTVLTAAHCINAQGPSANYFVLFGHDGAAPRRTVAVRSQLSHPNYSGRSFDFGLLQLAVPVTDTTPIELNTTALSSADVGRVIRHVGFGVTDGLAQSGGGRKRQVSYAVRSVEERLVWSGAVGQQTCSGDSGGPGFMVTAGSSEPRLAGVVSFGDQACTQTGADGRVDIVVPWIRQSAAQWDEPTCAQDGACKPGCAPVDADCACARDGQCPTSCPDFNLDPDCPVNCGLDAVCAVASCPRPDPDCTADGLLCVRRDECQARLCQTDPQHPQSYCTRRCASAADCATGLECADAVCRYPQKPERQLTQSCSPSRDHCVDSVCTGPAGGITRCVRSCSAQSDCLSGESCLGGADAQRFCRPPGLSFEPPTLPLADTFTVAAAQGCTAAAAPLFVPLLLAWLGRRRRLV